MKKALIISACLVLCHPLNARGASNRHMTMQFHIAKGGYTAKAINEIKLRHGEVVFYSKCRGIYKSNEVIYIWIYFTVNSPGEALGLWFTYETKGNDSAEIFFRGGIESPMGGGWHRRLSNGWRNGISRFA